MYHETFGAIFSPKDVRDYRIACASGETFPEEFELSMPEVKNQSLVGSCVAHSISTVVEYYSRKQGDETREMSVGYIYGNRTNSSHKGTGMVTKEAIAVTCEYGDVVLDSFPHHHEVPAIIDKFNDCVDELFPEGYPHRFSSYYKCEGENEIKTALMKNGPVIIAVKWYKDIMVSKGVIKTTADPENSAGGHCMVLYGWNKQGWKIQNSWGKFWGDGGRAIWPYDVPIREAFGVIDEFSNKQNLLRIEELEKSNAELQAQVQELSAQLAELDEQITALYNEMSTSEKPVLEIAVELEKLSKEREVLDKQFWSVQRTIETQEAEIERLKKEMVVIKRPYKSKLGRIVAKVINLIIQVFDWFKNL